jgi:hypothetical protein
VPQHDLKLLTHSPQGSRQASDLVGPATSGLEPLQFKPDPEGRQRDTKAARIERHFWRELRTRYAPRR